MDRKKYSYIGITFVVLVFGIIFIPRIVDRLSEGDVSREESRSRSVQGVKPGADSGLAYLEVNGQRKKVPSFRFTNQHRATITEQDYLGKVYVVEFFFTSCPTICPRMSRNLVAIQDSFQDLEGFGVASFTINPDHDTPEVLKQYAESYGMTLPDWHLMTGDRETIYELANAGFNLYTAQDDQAAGGFEHSGNFALIDKEGYIRSRTDAHGNPIIYYYGVISEAEGTDDEGRQQEISILKEDIRKLLEE